ncbi:hypothetical protein A2U01_0068039, partial [Trifolium medium]|nr:hypothetical protein [Trifolium medium]
GDVLSKLFSRLFNLSLDKESRVSDMIVEEEGVKKAPIDPAMVKTGGSGVRTNTRLRKRMTY